MGSYTLRDAARILKVTPQRLRYWERTVLARLSVRAESVAAPERDAARSGARRAATAAAGDSTRGSDGAGDWAADDAFEFRDLVCARAVLGLIQQGIPLRRIRRSVEVLRETLPEIDDPVGALRVWAEGSPRMVVDHDGRLLEPEGQMVLDFRVPEAGETEVLELEERRGVRGHDAHEWFEKGCQLDSDPETFAAAVEAYRQAVTADPEMADAHCNLGAVLYNQGERGRAKACFERCLEIDPWHVEANFNLANVLEEEGRDRDALRHYSSALKGDPLYPDLHVNLALLFEKLGERERARLHWHRYLQLEPTGAWAEVARGRVQEERVPEKS
ncbi:MAG: tetratricopeptide repeat protein [Myxococcota bacterium]